MPDDRTMRPHRPHSAVVTDECTTLSRWPRVTDLCLSRAEGRAALHGCSQSSCQARGVVSDVTHFDQGESEEQRHPLSSIVQNPRLRQAEAGTLLPTCLAQRPCRAPASGEANKLAAPLGP